LHARIYNLFTCRGSGFVVYYHHMFNKMRPFIILVFTCALVLAPASAHCAQAGTAGSGHILSALKPPGATELSGSAGILFPPAPLGRTSARHAGGVFAAFPMPLMVEQGIAWFSAVYAQYTPVEQYLLLPLGGMMAAAAVIGYGWYFFGDRLVSAVAPGWWAVRVLAAGTDTMSRWEKAQDILSLHRRYARRVEELYVFGNYPETRAVALAIMSRLGVYRHAEILKKALESDRAMIRAAAARGLRDFRDGIPQQVRAMFGSGYEDVLDAFVALDNRDWDALRTAGEQALPAIYNALRDKSPAVVMDAAAGLVRVGCARLDEQDELTSSIRTFAKRQRVEKDFDKHTSRLRDRIRLYERRMLRKRIGFDREGIPVFRRGYDPAEDIRQYHDFGRRLAEAEDARQRIRSEMRQIAGGAARTVRGVISLYMERVFARERFDHMTDEQREEQLAALLNAIPLNGDTLPARSQ